MPALQAAVLSAVLRDCMFLKKHICHQSLWYLYDIYHMIYMYSKNTVCRWQAVLWAIKQAACDCPKVHVCSAKQSIISNTWYENMDWICLCMCMNNRLLQKYLLTKQRWTCTVTSHGQPAAMSPCWPVHCRWTEASTGCAVWVNPLGQKLPQEMQKCHGKPSTHQNPLWHLAGKPYLLNTRGSKSSWPSVP